MPGEGASVVSGDDRFAEIANFWNVIAYDRPMNRVADL
jgi:hypothetical protein